MNGIRIRLDSEGALRIEIPPGLDARLTFERKAGTWTLEQASVTPESGEFLEGMTGV